MPAHITSIKVLVAASLFATAGSMTQAQTSRAPAYRYEPDTVRITGTLARHMYYGAPGFGEDPKHDEKEIGFYLDLSSPICTDAGRDDGDVATKGVRRIQLVLDPEGYARLKPFLTRRVTLRGTLFGAMTGHHHTPILLSVSKPIHVER